MSRTIIISTKSATERKEVLDRLRARRAKGGRRSEVTVGALLLPLKESGDITPNEFDYVMGLRDSLKPDEKMQHERKR